MPPASEAERTDASPPDPATSDAAGGPAADSPAAARVFVSHSSEDAAAATALCEALEAEGLSCWIAPRDVAGGTPYAREITRAIRSARAVLLLLSRAACRSDYVLREIDLAASASVPVVAVRLEEVRPSDDLAFYIGKEQWIDALHPPIRAHLPRIRAALATASRPREGDAPEAAWAPPREAALKALSSDLRRYQDLTWRLKATMEEATSVLVGDAAARQTLLEATLAYNGFSPGFIDRIASHRAAVRKYWGDAHVPDFDYLHHLAEEDVYRGALFRLNPVRARLNALFATPGDAAACAELDRTKRPLLDALQERLDALARAAIDFLGALERST